MEVIKMQAGQGKVIVTIIIASLVILGAGYLAVNKVIDNMPEVPEINIPSAEAIGAAINIDVEIPEQDQRVINDIYEKEFEDEIDDLEEDCQEALWDEYEDDLEDDLEDLLELAGVEVKDISVVDFNYDDDYDFTVLNLGLDDEEDREGEVYTVLRVKYHEVFGDSDWHFEKVEATGVCSDWDSSDDEFDDLTADYQLA